MRHALSFPALFCLSVLLLVFPTFFAAQARDAASFFAEGASLEDAGDFEQAISRYRAAQSVADGEENPSLAAESLLHMGDCYRALDDTLEFRRSAEDVLRRYPNQEAPSARAMIRIAEDCWRTGDAGAAQEILSRVEQQYPEDSDAIALARLQLVRMKLAGDNPEGALADAEAALSEAAGGEEWYPDVRELRDRARVGRAEKEITQPDTRAEGVADLEAVIDDPGTPPVPRASAHYQLSLARYWERDYAGSISAAEGALAVEAIEDTGLLAWAGLQVAIAAVARGDLDRAYQAIIDCHREHSDYQNADFQRSLDYRFREIVNAKRAAGDLPPEPADPDPALSAEAKAQTGAAFALVYTGDATGAISLLQNVIADYASQLGAVGWGRYRLAEAYYQNRDYPNAIATAQGVLSEYSAGEYTLLCARTDLVLAIARLANGEPESALATLERCERAYALVEDEGFHHELGARLHQARNAVRRSEKDERPRKLALVNNRWLPRPMRREALLECAGLCERQEDTLGALRAHVRLRQEFGDDPATLAKANEYLVGVLGRGNVPAQAEILRQAQDATDDIREKEMIQEEIAWRYLTAGYIDEATLACREAIQRFGREAIRSYRLLVTKAEAHLRAKNRFQAWTTYRAAVPVPFVHSERNDALIRKLGWLYLSGYGKDDTVEFYEGLDLPADDAQRFAWKSRAEIGPKRDIDGTTDLVYARLAQATTNQERLPLYWALLWCHLYQQDYPSVEAAIQEMRDVIGDDCAVDRVLLDIVIDHLGPRGEVVCMNIINNSECELMRQAATFEMGWCKRNEKDRDGALEWYEQAASMEWSPGKECIYQWMGHREAAAFCVGKGKEFFPAADMHFQEAVFLAQECYPKGLAVSYGSLAQVRELQGDLEGAAELYQQAIRAATGEEDLETWDSARVRLGRVRMKQGNTDAAREVLEEARATAFHREHVEWAERLLDRLEQGQ
jgi:tetratricopeptide (TPR) repeat protein